MSGHTFTGLEAWEYFRNSEGSYSVYSAKCDKHKHFPKIVLAEVFTEHVDNPEANARLIASAPEMRVALIGAAEALRATEVFMCDKGFSTAELNKIVDTIFSC